MNGINKNAFAAAFLLCLCNYFQAFTDSPETSNTVSSRATFDEMFAESPVMLARLEAASKQAAVVIEKIKDLKIMSPSDIKLYLHSVIDPVKGFLNEIYSNGSLLKPILLETISRDSLLITFFDQSNVNTFFENKITTKETLEQTLNELIKVVKSFMDELEPDTKAVYKAYKTRVDNKKSAA